MMANSWKVILATMIIFAAGVVTGGLLVRHSMLKPEPKAQKQHAGMRPGPVTPGNMRLEFLRRAQRELDLTPEQRERIDHILGRSQERTRKVMEPLAPKLREEVQRAREEFRQVLTPRQRTQFDRLTKQQQRSRNITAPQRDPQRARPPAEAPPSREPSPTE